jgi:hypothetical protein
LEECRERERRMRRAGVGLERRVRRLQRRCWALPEGTGRVGHRRRGRTTRTVSRRSSSSSPLPSCHRKVRLMNQYDVSADAEPKWRFRFTDAMRYALYYACDLEDKKSELITEKQCVLSFLLLLHPSIPADDAARVGRSRRLPPARSILRRSTMPRTQGRRFTLRFVAPFPFLHLRPSFLCSSSTDPSLSRADRQSLASRTDDIEPSVSREYVSSFPSFPLEPY